MNTKNNKRFQAMDKKLKDTLLELMKITDYDKITVKKLCETANVNRSTFYAHFSDIPEIMRQMEEHLNQEFLDSYTEVEKYSDVFTSWPFVPFLKHIKKHSYFYKIALKERKSFPLTQGYEPLLNEIIKPKCIEAGITSESDMMYYFVYFQAGFTMLLKRWVDNGCIESEQEISNIIRNCIPSIWNAIK